MSWQRYTRSKTSAAPWVQHCKKVDGTQLAESDVLQNEQKKVVNEATIREQVTIKRRIR